MPLPPGAGGEWTTTTLLQVDRAVLHQAGHAAGNGERRHRADISARHLPRHRPQPAGPGHVSYLLWMLIGYLLVTAVLVVFFVRLGDVFGLVRI
jgi:hypothetical protein